jgi:glycosyltransferase involved in cell wall biosynthesis
MNKKLRVLVIAEACNPSFTSVPLIGYNLTHALALRDDLEITLVTHIRNKTALEMDPLSKHFIDNEAIARPLHKLGHFLRGDKGLSWTIGTAMSWPGYMYFEKMLFRQFRSKFNDQQFDVIHRITPLTPTMGSPLASLVTTPMVIGPLNGGLPWPKEYPELRRQEREWLVPVRNLYKHLPFFSSTYKRLAAVISGSKHTATEVPINFSGQRFEMPENGIDTLRFPLDRVWLETGKPFRFITVGRLVPYKGTDMVLDAMAESEILRQCELTVVGDGPQRQTLEEQVSRLDLVGNVRLLGWKSQSELSAELREAQVFVFPSLREFGGGAVLEAMASGLPCVIADYGGPAELVDSSCGILLPLTPRAEMVSNLRHAMEHLVNDPAHCKTLSKNGIEKVRSHFTWSAKAKKIVGIYRCVINA